MPMVRLEPPAELSMPIGEAMFTQRAIRRLDPNRDISDAQIKLMLEAASKAPSGGNVQPTRFLVVRDKQLIKDFGVIYHEAWWAKRRDDFGWSGWDDIPAGSAYRFAARLTDEIGDAPLMILTFSTKQMSAGHSVFPNVQNLLLAARALGIGSVLTTLHPEVMDRVYAMFKVPEQFVFHCCIPLGYPRGKHGTTARLPTVETTSWNSWDQCPPWST
jgi:nitroreductase